MGEYAKSGNTGWVGKMSGAIASITEGKLSLSLTGSAEAYLYRNNEPHQLNSDKSHGQYRATQTFENIVAGPTNEGDKILLATPAIMHQVAKSELQALVWDNSPNSAIAKIAEAIRSQRQTDRVAAIITELTSPELVASQPPAG